MARHEVSRSRAQDSTRGCAPICPIRRCRRGIDWIKVVGPGVIVLGLSLGGGEFLLGPTAFVRYGLSLLWITLVVRVLPDHLQHRADALHARDRRAGLHRLHAHASVARVLGVVLCRSCTCCRWDGRIRPGCRRARCFFLATRRSPRRQMRRRSISIGVGTFLLCIVLLDAGPPHRAHARAAQLGDGGRASSADSSLLGAVLRSRLDLGGRRCRVLVGFDLPRRTIQLSAGAMPTFCCWPRWRATPAPEAW